MLIDIENYSIIDAGFLWEISRPIFDGSQTVKNYNMKHLLRHQTSLTLTSNFREHTYRSISAINVGYRPIIIDVGIGLEKSIPVDL